MPIIYESGKPENAPRLNAIMRRALAHWDYSDDDVRQMGDALEIPADMLAKGATIVVDDGDSVDDSDIVAFAHARQPPEGDTWLLTHFYVDPDSMGAGIGRAMWTAICTILARAWNVRRLLVPSDPNAVGFFKHMGASELGIAEPIVANGENRPVLIADLDPEEEPAGVIVAEVDENDAGDVADPAPAAGRVLLRITGKGMHPVIELKDSARAGELTDLALRYLESRGHPSAHLERCREELAFDAEDVENTLLLAVESPAGDSFLGYCCAWDDADADDNLRTWIVPEFFVDPQAAGHGVGRSLFAALATILTIRPGERHIHIPADPNAVRFFQRFGCRRASEVDNKLSPDGRAPLMAIDFDGHAFEILDITIDESESGDEIRTLTIRPPR